MMDPFEIVVGTYEQYLLGYRVTDIVNEYKAEKCFAVHSHLGSIRSIAGSKHYLASAGADDSVYLYDLRRRTETGRLVHHNDTVNCITFTPDSSHLFTCSYDGTIAAIRCGNWQIEKHWQTPHKSLPVNSMAIHPTGRLALSTGKDGILRTWNLVKGRLAYATNLMPTLKLDAKNVNVLKWSPNGEKYLLAVNQRVDIYLVELAGISKEIKFDSKIICVEFLDNDLIAVGFEDGHIELYDIEKSMQVVKKIAHDIRIKCMACMDDLLITASSSGEIKIWRYGKHKLDMMQTMNCGARITCLSLLTQINESPATCNTQSENEQEIDERHLRIQNERKIRLRQEVIVEEYDTSKVVESFKKKRSMQAVEKVQLPNTKKSKLIIAKKNQKLTSFVDESQLPPPKKRKKLLNEALEEGTIERECKKDGSLKKKRKKGAVLCEENNKLPPKKVKKANGETSLKTNSAMVPKMKSIPPKKRQRETTLEETMTTAVILKKKKKKKQ